MPLDQNHKIAQQRVVRLFISSTFRDMQAERDEMVKRTFPRDHLWFQAINGYGVRFHVGRNDGQAEREELGKRIFPPLRKLCEKFGVTWGEVDPRWEITDE